jgi:anti-sigma B factor antagonist
MPDIAPAPVLTIDIKPFEGGAVVYCHGKLVAGVTDVLYLGVKALIPGTKRIVLDLTDLTYSDSMGLGTLVRLYASAKTAGCNLELINLSKQIKTLLGITNLLTTFTVIGENGIKFM